MSKSPARKLLLITILCLLPGLVSAQINDPPGEIDDTPIDYSTYNLYGWGIDEFHSDIRIFQDSTIEITETLIANFSQASAKHGIIRFIPIKYKDRYQQNLDIRFSLITVTDDKGTPYETSVSYPGNNVSLRIGSPDVYVDGDIKTYIIKYKLERGLNRFGDHDELYWNITGNDWDTAVTKASATVHLPSAVENPSELKAICYTGVGYSNAHDCETDIMDGQTFLINNLMPLYPGEGISFAIAFPKGLVNFPGIMTYLSWFISDNWGYLIPLLVLAYLYYQWNKYGRDPIATHTAIMPEYDVPDNLRPAELGTMIDDTVDMRDITSTIIDFATRGYLKIIENKKKGLLWGEETEYTLEKTTPEGKTATPLEKFETKIYEAIFSGNESIDLDSLKYKFYKHIPAIKTEIYNTLVSKKYYASSPEKARESYMGIGGAIALVTFFFLGFLIDVNLSVFIGLLATGALVFAFSFIMPKKTQAGADMRIRILGVEEFIKTAEKDRMKFYEDQNIFEKMLPYAIALGLADKWAKACEDIYNSKPDWYQSSDPNFIRSFNAWNFLHAINSFNNTMSSNMTASPRSAASGGSSGFGGGGFSGGGFGGGGGSSW